MYFWFFKRKKRGKKTVETRRRNCAVLPKYKRAHSRRPSTEGVRSLNGKAVFLPACR